MVTVELFLQPLLCILFVCPGGAENIVRFYREHEELPEDDMNHIELLEMSRELWEEFGKPETGTVTFRAGDKLNVDR